MRKPCLNDYSWCLRVFDPEGQPLENVESLTDAARERICEEIADSAEDGELSLAEFEGFSDTPAIPEGVPHSCWRIYYTGEECEPLSALDLTEDALQNIGSMVTECYHSGELHLPDLMYPPCDDAYPDEDDAYQRWRDEMYENAMPERIAS